jgi:hypothetical protein
MSAAGDYLYGGLIFRSSVPLPLMPLSLDARPVDVDVAFAPLPAPTAECLRAMPHFAMYADGTAILRSPHGIRMLIDNGRALRIEVPEGVDARLVQSWLIGPGLGLIMHQRGVPPLHACAVSRAGRALAIAGDSGAGKSTTARALMERGYDLMAEDQAIIDPAHTTLFPGVTDLRLWAAAAERFGERTEERSRVGVHEDKFTISSSRERFDRTSRPLAALFVLSCEPAETPVSTRLSGGAAAHALHRHIYRQRLATFMGRGADMFGWATALAARVPVYAVRRPNDLSRLDALAAHIEQVVEQLR